MKQQTATILGRIGFGLSRYILTGELKTKRIKEEQEPATLFGKATHKRLFGERAFYFLYGLKEDVPPLVMIAFQRLRNGGISERLEVKYAERIADYLVRHRIRKPNEYLHGLTSDMPFEIMFKRKLSDGAQKVFVNVFGFTHEMHKKGEALALLESGNVTEPEFVSLLKETAYGKEPSKIKSRLEECGPCGESF